MQRGVVLLMGLLLLAPAVAAAGPVSIVAGNHLLPDDGGTHTIQIRAFGPGGLQGVKLNIAVGGGGASSGGTDGPAIDLIDAQSAGTIFFGNASASTFFTSGQLGVEGFTTLGGTEDADANGNLLAFVTINLAGYNAGSAGDLGAGKWTFKVSGVPGILFPTSDWNGSAGITPVMVDGSIQIVPEPGSIVLCLFAAAGVAIVAIRRRRAGRGGLV